MSCFTGIQQAVIKDPNMTSRVKLRLFMLEKGLMNDFNA